MANIEQQFINLNFDEEKDKLAQGVNPEKKLQFKQIMKIIDQGTVSDLDQVEIFNMFQSFFREDGGYIDFLKSKQNGNFYLDKLYSFKEHGRTHIDGANKIPIVNSLTDFKDGHPGLMSANQAKFLENMGYGGEDKEVKSGEGSSSTLDSIQATSPDYMIKMHSKVYIGASDSLIPKFNDQTNLWKPGDVAERGLTVAGSTKVARIADSYLQVGELTTFYQNGDAVIGDSLSIKGKLSLDGTADLTAKGNIRTQKCFVTLDTSTGDEAIINICENRIINETIDDYKDLYFYVGDKSYNSGSNSKPTMIMGYDSVTKTGKVAINTTSPPTASSPEFSVAGSSSLGISGYSASTLQIFGSYIQIQSPTAVSLKNIPLESYSPTSMDISSYGGLSLQGDITMSTNKEVVVGSLTKKVGVDIYGDLHLSSPTTNHFPIGFYNNLPADTTSPTTSLLGVPFSVRYDGKFGIRTLPGDYTMRVMGSAEFLSETGSSVTYDNIVYLSELQNPGSAFNASYDTTTEYFGNNGTLVVKGTNIARTWDSGTHYDIHLTGGKSLRYRMDGTAGVFHGVKIDGKVDIGTVGVEPKENLTLYNGSLIFPATNLDAKIDILGSGNITLNSGDVILSGGNLDIGSTYGFNKEGIITAEELHLGLVIDTSTGEFLNTYTKYGFFEDGLTNVGDLYVYGDFIPQNITNIDLGGGRLTSTHDIEGEQAPTVDSESAWSDSFKDGFFGTIKDYKSIEGSGEWGYLEGNNPITNSPYHVAQSTAGGGSARPYDHWSNISNFHNIYGATKLLREYTYSATLSSFDQEDRLVGKLSGFKYFLAGNKTVSEDAGDNPPPYIRGFANIYGLFSSANSYDSIDREWDATDAGDIKYFKNIVGFDTDPNKNSIELLIDDIANEGQKKKNPLYPTYGGGSLQFFKEIKGLTDSVHRGGIERYSHIDLSYWDEPLQRNITTAKFSKTDSDIFNSLLIVGDPTSKLDSYSGLILKGGDNAGLIQKDVTLNWDSAEGYFSFHFTDSETTPSSPDKIESAVDHVDWATVKVGTLWVKGEELTAPVSVINNLNTNGILFTDGSNKMLGNLNIDRNNINDVTIAYIDEIRITPDPNPFHLDITGSDPTTLNIYSVGGYVDPDSLSNPRPLLIAPEDNAYLVFGEDNKGTGVVIGKSDSTLSKIIAGWDTTSSASLALYYRDSSGGVKQGLKLEEDGDVKINFGDFIVPSSKSVKIGSTTILDNDSLTVGTNAIFANTGITVSSDFAITAGATVAFKIISASGLVGIGDWSTGTISNQLDVKGTFQASGDTTIGGDATIKGVTYLGDPNEHQLKISQETYILDSEDKEWMRIEAVDADRRLLLDASPEGLIHMTSSEFSMGKAFPPNDAQGVGETGRFAWEADDLIVTGTEGNNNATGEYFAIGVNPNTGNTPNATNSAITLDEFNNKNKTFLRLFSDSSQWHNTHKYFKPSFVVGNSDEYWDATLNSNAGGWKTDDAVPYYEYIQTEPINPPENWILWTRYLDTLTTSQDDSVDATKFTFFIQVPTGSSEELLKVGYYITGIPVNDSGIDNTTRYYITKIKDLTSSGNPNDSNRKGFQIFTIPTNDSKIPDEDDYANTAWKYRSVEFPALTINGILKADNIGTAKLDATDLSVEKICFVPLNETSPKGCIYIDGDSTDSNKNKWFFDADIELDDIVFTGKGENSVDYSWTAQEKLYGHGGNPTSQWTNKFSAYYNARNTVLKLDNLADGDMGAKNPKLVMTVSPSGVLHSTTTEVVKGMDFFELTTDAKEIDTRENPYDSSEDLVQLGKNAMMSLYRHKRNTGSTSTLADYTTGNALKQEYFKIDTREYFYESATVAGSYTETIESKNYDSFIRGTFDIKDHGVKPNSTQTDDPPLATQLLGLRLAGDLVESTADELNYLANITAGTTTASKALVVDGSKQLDYLKLTTDAYLPSAVGTASGTWLGGVLITATANELNILDGVTADYLELNYLDFPGTGWNRGTITADRAVTVNDFKHVNEWHIGDVTLPYANDDHHRLDLIHTDDSGDPPTYDFQIKVDSDINPSKFSNLTVQSQQHLYLKTQPYNAHYGVNGNVYIQPDKSIYFESTNSVPTNGHYLFGTKKTGNFVSIGGDFSSEETDVVYASATPSTVLYTNVDPTITDVTVDVVANPKTVILGFLTSSTIVPNDSDYIRLSVDGTTKILRIDEVASISSGGTATVPDLAEYNNKTRNWYKITLTENIPDSVLLPGGVWGDTTPVPKPLNEEFGIVPGNTNLNQKTLYDNHVSANSSDPYTSNSYLYRSTENVMISGEKVDGTSGFDFASLFDGTGKLMTSPTWDEDYIEDIWDGDAYLVGIKSYWENYSGTEYDGDDVAPLGSYTLGGSETILIENDYFWAGKPNGIHDHHRITSDIVSLGQYTVMNQSYDWYYVDLSSFCGLRGVYGQLGSTKEYRTGSGFTFVNVTATGGFLETPDQALTLQGVMSMVGIDPVYQSPYDDTDTTHYYSEADSTTGYLQNPSPINNRGHLWFDQDTDSLQFSIKSDNLWSSEPIFTPGIKDETGELNDLKLTTVDNATIAVDTEIIVQAVVVAGNETVTNKFKWKKTTDVGFSADTDMVLQGSAVNIVAGVDIYWESLTGHSNGSQWRFRKGNTKSLNLSSSAEAQKWEVFGATQDIYMRDGYVGIFKFGDGTPDPIDALHIGHRTGNLLLQYPNDTAYTWSDRDAPDLIIKEASQSDTKIITLGLSEESPYQPRLEVENDHFRIDVLDSKNLYLQQSTVAGKLIIGSTTDLGTMVSINDDVTIQKDLGTPLLTVKNTSTIAGSEVILADDSNNPIEAIIKDTYTGGVSLVQPTAEYSSVTYNTDPSYYTGEKILNIHSNVGTTNAYMVLKRTPAFSGDNDSKGALGLGTPTPYKRLHVKDGNVLIENSEPVLSLGTPDLIYKSGKQDYGSGTYYYAEIFHNKDARLNFSAGDKITEYEATQPTWNHGGKLDIVYRRGYDKITTPGYTDADNIAVSATAGHTIEDKNIFEITTTTYDTTATGPIEPQNTFPNDLAEDNPKTRFVIDGETGNVGIGGSFDRYPARERIHPNYKLDVEGGMRLGINFNSLSGFNALTNTGNVGGYLNDYKYTYDTLADATIGTNSDFVITKEIVKSVERTGTVVSPDNRSYRHTMDHGQANTYPYSYGVIAGDDISEMDYLASVQISGRGVSYFAGGDVGIGKYFEDTRNVAGRKPTSKLHVKDFAFTEVVETETWYAPTTEAGTVADANKFVESESVLMATFEDVEKTSGNYGSVSGLTTPEITQQTGKWANEEAGGKLNFYTKTTALDKENLMISSENTRDGLLLDATGTNTNYQLYLQKDGDVGIGQTFSFIDNVSSAITKKNILQRVTDVGTGSNLNGLEVKYQSIADPQLFFLDNNKITINTYDPESTSTSGQFYLYDSTDSVSLAFVSSTQATLTYNDITGYTAPDADDTLKFDSTTITVGSSVTNDDVVTITTTGLNDWGDAKTEFRHDLLGSIDATLTVNGFISADNIDPSGITVGHNESLTVKYDSVKHNVLMRRNSNGSIGGKDLFVHAGNLDADLHLATFHDTGTSATDNAKIRMTIGDSNTTGTAYSSFIHMFEDVTIKDAKDFEMFDATGTPAKKFSIDGVTGNTEIVGTLDVTADLDVNSKFAVTASTGAVAQDGGLTINTNKFAVTDAGAVSHVSDLAINTDKFTVAGASGNTSIAGTLGVTDATTLSDTLGVAGISTLAIVDIAGGADSAIDNTTIGASVHSTGKFTTLESTGVSTLASLGVTAGATVGTTLGVTGATTLSSTLDVVGKSTLSSAEIESDLAISSRLTVGYPYAYLTAQQPPIATVLDIRKETQYSNDTARDSELRPIVATFSKKDYISSGAEVGDRGHTGSVRVLFTPQPYTMRTAKTQNYEDSNNVVLDWISVTSVTLDYQTTSAMKDYVMPVIGDTITVGSDTLTIDNVSISEDTVTITHDDSVTEFADTKEFSHAYFEGHPITISGNTSNYNVAELEVNAVASSSDLFSGSKEGDLLFKNYFASEAGTGGYIQFYTAKSLVKSGSESQNSIAPSMIIGAGDTHGQLGVGMAPISGLGGSVATDDLDTRGATLALKGKVEESYLKAKIEVPASIYFEDAGGVNKARITLTENGKLEIPTQASPVETPFAIGSDAVEIGKDLVPYLYDHTGLEESQENSGTTKDLFFSNLDEYGEEGSTTDFIVAGVFLKIYKHDDPLQATFEKRKVTAVNPATKIVTIDEEIPATYDFQTIYPSIASDYPNATQTVGSAGDHVIKIGGLGSVYSGTTTVVFQIEIGSTSSYLNANEYRWRRKNSGEDYGEFYVRSITQYGTKQDLGKFVGDETAVLNPEKDWYGVQVLIPTPTIEATPETFEFQTRLPSKVEVYKDVDLGTTDNAFDDIYAQGFAMKKLDSAPAYTSEFGKIWIKEVGDGQLWFQNSVGGDQQISDLSNNFSSVNVNLVPSVKDTYDIGYEGTALGDDNTASTADDWENRKTFKDIYYEGSLKKWNGSNGYITIGEETISAPNRHAIQVNANSNTYIVNDNTAPFSFIKEEFDNTIRESYMDLQFEWTPTGGEILEDAFAGTELAGNAGDQWGGNIPEIIETFPSTVDGNVKLLIQSNSSGGDSVIVDNSSSNHGFDRSIGGSAPIMEHGGSGKFTPTALHWRGDGTTTSGYGGNGILKVTGTTGDWDFGTEDFTIEMWVNHESPRFNIQQTYVSDPTDQDNIWFGKRSSTDSHKLALYTDSFVLTGETSLSADTWYHVALTRTSGTMRIFLDGVDDTDGGETIADDFDQGELWIGSQQNDGGEYAGLIGMQGFMDDIRITKGVGRYTQTFYPGGWTEQFENPKSVVLLNGTETVVGSANQISSVLGNLEATLGTGVAQTYDTLGKFGSGYSFDNSEDHDGITFNGPGGFGLRNFTIEFWFNKTSGDGTLFHCPDSENYTNAGNHGVKIRTDSGVVKSDFGAEGANNLVAIVGTTTIENGKWYHVAFVRIGRTHSLYVNGKLDASTVVDQYEVCSYGNLGNFSSNSVQIASWKKTMNNVLYVSNFHGVIDDFRIADHARYHGTSTTTSGTGTITIGSDTDAHFANNPETSILSTSLLVPMDFDSWRDNDVRFKVKVNNTADSEIQVDIYDTAQTQVGTTQTLSTATTWTDVVLNEFVPDSGTPEWTKGEAFSIYITTKLKKTSASVQLSTLRFQYNTESYSTTNVPLPHITSTSTETEIDQQLAIGGNVLPTTDGDKNLGSSTKKWNQLNAVDIHTHDLHLNNEGSQGNDVDGTTGNWTVQEGDEDLFIINRKTGKKFKFKLEEIE